MQNYSKCMIYIFKILKHKCYFMGRNPNYGKGMYLKKILILRGKNISCEKCIFIKKKVLMFCVKRYRKSINMLRKKFMS